MFRDRCFGIAVSVFAQTERAGNIVAVKGQEIQVKNENVDSPFMAGERLHLLTGDKSVELEVTFPMQTVAKCRLVSGRASTLRVGMIVYSGGQPAASKESLAEERIASAKSDGNKVTQGKDVSISLPAAAFVLKDALVPKGGIAFPTGTSDDKTERIEKGFLISETETTYEQWMAVKKWAESHGYSFKHSGENGHNKKGGKAMDASISTKFPVTRLSWRDAIVWCNALTEYYNAAQKKETLDCVYYTDASYTTPLRTSTSREEITDSLKGSQDCPYIKAASSGNTEMENCTSKGFRLPTSVEWEYAARYRGHDNVNTVEEFRDPYFTKGDSASGAIGSYKDDRATDEVAVFEKYYSVFKTGDSATAKVKSKNANPLGLYDMSGNVWEWCFDWCRGSKRTTRVLRGGNFNDKTCCMQVGGQANCSPYSTRGFRHDAYGFRFARTK